MGSATGCAVTTKEASKASGIFPDAGGSEEFHQMNEIRTINRKDRNSIRYMCRTCNKNYHVPCQETTESAVKKDGFTDDALLGLSTRENVLKLYVDRGELMVHNTVLARLNQNMRHVKMFTDDVLCCLKYGDVWGIDETEIEIRGSAREKTRRQHHGEIQGTVRAS